MILKLHLTLRSDTTFGRGDGVAGFVDTETEYDTVTGLPQIKGRTIRGLIVEECANILYAIGLQNNATISHALEAAASTLFGKPGSHEDDSGILHVGTASAPEAVIRTIQKEIESNALTRDDVRNLTTTLRRQTAMDEQTGTPKRNSLRTERVVIRETQLFAELVFSRNPSDLEKALLAAIVKMVRRGGIGRNRGRGRLEAKLFDGTNEVSHQELFDLIQKMEAAQ